jgi:hypothetical protein
VEGLEMCSFVDNKGQPLEESKLAEPVKKTIPGKENKLSKIHKIQNIHPNSIVHRPSSKFG